MGKEKFNNVYQFKITLKDTNPPVWRRIQAPANYTFWDLHVAVQDAMGWSDYHLHEFTLKNPSTGLDSDIGIPDEEGDFEDNMLAGWKLKISEWFSLENEFWCDQCNHFVEYHKSKDSIECKCCEKKLEAPKAPKQ